MQCDEHRTCRVCVGFHPSLLYPSAFGILLAQQFLRESLCLLRRQLQFVSETQTEDLVFRVCDVGRFQPLLNCGCSRRNRLSLPRIAVSIESTESNIVRCKVGS